MSINNELITKREKIQDCLRNAKLAFNIAKIDYETMDKAYDNKLQRHRYATGELAKASATGMKYALEIATAAETAYQTALANLNNASAAVLTANTTILEWQMELHRIDMALQRSGFGPVSLTPATTPRLKTMA